MSTLVESVKRIGIFMIAAQTVIHFAPGQKYEKYIKLLVGMMILLQFVMPLHDISGRAEIDWSAEMADMEKLFEVDDMAVMTGGMNDGTAAQPALAESVINSLEDEIKSKLNIEMAEEGYVVSGVQVSMKSIGEAGSREYMLEKVRVVVYRRTVSADGREDENAGSAGNGRSEAGEETGETEIEKVKVEKISIGGISDGERAQDNGQTAVDSKESDDPYEEDTEEMVKRLRARFCSVLGVDEEKMEVSVYGTNEKADR